ncbi:MAG TPA: hypothetical protein VLR26_17475 [Frankiaceae bacterium]|nr:hypothetical protein [Frankiaceae bacterium]
MSPSTTARRAGVVTASAMALCLGGAFTAGSASALTICPVGQILSSTGTCVQKTVTSVVPTPPPTTPTGSGSGSGGTGGITIPLPTLPAPLPGTGSSGGSTGSGGSSGSSGGGIQLPGLPLPGLGGVTGGTTGTGGVGGITGPTVPGSSGSSTATADGSSVPGSKPATPGAATAGDGMLGPASAYLPASGILGFTSFSSLGSASIPTSSNLAAIPSPLLANQPAAQLAAVQAPLLAAGEDAGRGGTVLAAFGSYALPGLLVVLATAVVATVGAGNIRVWQARMAAQRR